MEAKATELRIGNYVASSGNPKNEETWVIGKVHSISSMDSQFEQIEVETDEDFTWFFKGNYFGIPLTEKWLLDFGFEKKCDYLYESEKFRIEPSVLDNAIWQFRFIISKNQSVWIASVIYIHQLQNLYFALTGEELTIKKID